MTITKIFLLFATAVSTLAAIGQEKRQVQPVDNPVRSKITAVNPSRSLYSVEVFSGKERDQKNRVVVNGLSVKGAIVSSAVSSVSTLSGGAGGGAASAAYAATGKIIFKADNGTETTGTTDSEGNFSVVLPRAGVYTIFLNGTECGQVVLKTKHDTAKNSIGNIR